MWIVGSGFLQSYRQTTNCRGNDGQERQLGVLRLFPQPTGGSGETCVFRCSRLLERRGWGCSSLPVGVQPFRWLQPLSRRVADLRMNGDGDWTRRRVLRSFVLAAVTATAPWWPFFLTEAAAVASPEKSANGPNSMNPVIGYVTKSGLKFFDFQVGDGASPEWGDFCVIQYVLYTAPSIDESSSSNEKNGSRLRKFDTTYGHGKGGYLIHHGNGRTIRGLDEALHTMRVGGRRRVIIPQQLGYSVPDVGPVPARTLVRRALADRLRQGDLLVMDVELAQVKKDPRDRGLYKDKSLDRESVLRDIAEYSRMHPDDQRCQ